MGRIHGLWSGDLRPVDQFRAAGPTDDGAAALGAVGVTTRGAGAT